jgi:CxxC motif-containing protein (DUF1111 family)
MRAAWCQEKGASAPFFFYTNQMTPRFALLLALAIFTATAVGALKFPRFGGGQTPAADPGPRGGSPGAGGPLIGLSPTDVSLFTAAKDIFSEVQSVSGTISGQDSRGLGPRFNAAGCAECHAHPAAGGTSPSINPQVEVANREGATNTIPPFITVSGPVVEVRSKLDNHVIQIFSIAGRSDAPVGCTLAQLPFPDGTFSLRIPTPLFGLGLVENVTDDDLIAAQNTTLMATLGITAGNFNRNFSSGTITRFGWKAQNQSLLEFAGEAYLMEQGVTNELFPTSKVSGVCSSGQQPEDVSDTVQFANFNRLLEPPSPAPDNASIINGRAKFQTVGCHACHVMSMTTTSSIYTGQSGRTFAPFSDFALHGMGSMLADGISQGLADVDEFRTAPLWGIGHRLFFMHDGRTSDLLQAILFHSSAGSEANTVIANFNTLSISDQQDILNFLRAL